MNPQKSTPVDLKKLTPAAALVKYGVDGFLHAGHNITEREWISIVSMMFGDVIPQPGNKLITDVKIEKEFQNRSDSKGLPAVPEHSDGSHMKTPIGALSLYCQEEGDPTPTIIVNMRRFFSELSAPLLNKFSGVSIEWVNDYTQESISLPIVSTINNSYQIRFSRNIALLGESSPSAQDCENGFQLCRAPTDNYYLAALLDDYCQNPDNQQHILLKKGEFLVVNNHQFLHLVNRKRMSKRWLKRTFHKGAGMVSSS